MTVARVRGDREERPRRERRDVGDMLYRIEVGRDDGVEVRHTWALSLTKATSAAVTLVNIAVRVSHSTIERRKQYAGRSFQHLTRTRRP